ncbi:MAG: hypothetical protein R2864_04535 [Syntrophotaleaceae bacterium]
MSITRILATLLCGSLLLYPFAVHGADRDSPSAIGGNELDLRLDFIETRLDAGKQHAQYWQNGWSGFYAVSALAQTISWLDADNNDDRINYAVGAVKATGSLLDMLAAPPPGRYGADAIRAVEGRSLDKLDKAENLLQAAAQRAQARTAWKPHLKVLGVNLLGGGVILAFGDRDDALLSTTLGIAVARPISGPNRPAQSLTSRIIRTTFLRWMPRLSPAGSCCLSPAESWYEAPSDVMGPANTAGYATT